MKVNVDIRFLVKSLLACALAAGAWTGLHAYQMERQRGTLLRLVDRAEAEGKQPRAARLLGQYVTLFPEEADARARYGILIETLPGTRPGRVAAVYEEVLRRAPDRHDIRRRLARLELFQLGRYDEAAAHLRELHDAFPKDGEVLEMLGQSLEAQALYPDAVETYRQAIAADAGRVAAYARYARVLDERLGGRAGAGPRADTPESLLRRMVENNPKSAPAYLARAKYALDKAAREGPGAAEALKRAAEDAATARRLAPQELAPLTVAAQVARKQGNLAAARDFLDSAVRLDPRRVSVYQDLAEVETDANRPEAAVACLRRGLEELPDNADLWFALAQLLIQTHSDEAQKAADQLSKLKAPAAQVAYVNASLQLARGQWAAAAGTLANGPTQQALAEYPALAARASVLLGRCYEQIGMPEQQLAAFREATRFDPLNGAARLGVATALMRLGQLDDAVQEAERAANTPNAPPAAALLHARLTVLQTLRVPPASRRWSVAVERLEHARRIDPTAAEVPVLWTEVLVAQGQPAEARRRLEQALAQAGGKGAQQAEKVAQQVELRVALADLCLHEGKVDEARAALDAAQKQLGDSPELRLARVRVSLSQAGASAPAELAKLAEGLDAFSEEGRAQVLGGVAEGLLQLGKASEAKGLVRRLADLRRDDLKAHLLWFDAALKDNDPQTMREQVGAIRGLEGAGGPLGHIAATSLLVWEARHGRKGALAEAQTELDEALKHQPVRPTVHLLGAYIAELKGDEAGAIKCYQDAVTAGNTQVEVASRLAGLLFKAQRYREAAIVLEKAAQRTAFSAELQRLSAEVSFQTRDYERARAAARRAVPPGSTDHRQYLWQGQFLWALGRLDEAEAPLRRAAELAGGAPDPWVALVQYLASRGRPGEAELVLRRAEKAVAADRAALALAQCYEALGNTVEAAKRYAAAAAADKANPAVHRAVADFYLRAGQLAPAQAELEQIIGLKDKAPEAAAEARRRQLVVLAARGNYRDARRALALMGVAEDAPARPAEAASPDDLRAGAMVLAAQHSRKRKAEAIEFMTRLAATGQLAPEDKYLFAHLYDAVGDKAKARDWMLRLLESAGNEPRYLSAQVAMLLRHGLTDEASSCLRGLEQRAKGEPLTVELTARVLHARKRDPEAAALLKGLARKDPKVSPRHIAAVLEELGLGEAAEEVYRDHAARAKAKEPEAVLALAGCVARRQRVAEALDLCEKAWATCPPEAVAQACSTILHAGPADETQCARVVGWLEKARKRGDKPILACALADVYELRGRYADAEALYRRVLRDSPRHVVALNNLAWLLASYDRQGDEAVRLATTAINAEGPAPEVLDTRAMAYLAARRPDKAINDLYDAIDGTGPKGALAAVLQYHLARAYLAAGNQTAAADAFQAAKAAHFQAAMLHPVERDSYAQTVQQLASAR